MASLAQVAMQPQTIAIVALCFTLFAFIHHRLTRSPSLSLPPGPPGSFVFGNSIPKSYAFRQFETWTRQYGPVFTLREGFSTLVVIGRLQAAIDIMEKEGAATVDRPHNISVGETLSGGMRVVLTPAGEMFRKMRRALQAQLRPKVVTDYSSILMRNAKQHIIDIINDPLQHENHAKLYAASVVMGLAYGKKVHSFSDPDVQTINHCTIRLGVNLRPGIWKVDSYPFMRYIPGYLKELKEGHTQELTLFTRLLSEVKEKMRRTTEGLPPSLSKYLLERQREFELTDREVAYLVGSMFSAGSGTTAGAISTCILAAACYPDAQRRVQAELDAVIGRERAPVSSDQEALPQTMAFVLETFRWRPVAPGGIAHKTTRDIVWGNYVIPKGVSVTANIWSVGRDPDFFPDPESFNPQRWLTDDGRIKEDLKSYTFGFGRRVCPGQHLATTSVFVNAALIHWAFNVLPDPSSPIDQMAYTDSATSHPLPFKVVFEPRVAGTMERIKEMLEDYGC